MRAYRLSSLVKIVSVPGLCAVAAMAVGSTLVACSANVADGEGEGDLGQAQLALASVPNGVACLQVEVVGRRTVQRTFDVAPGTPADLPLSGLPTGFVQFAADAFDAPCSALTGNSSPSWVSEPVSVELRAGEVAPVALRMKRNAGRAQVSVDFEDDDVDGGAFDGGAFDGGFEDGGAIDGGSFDGGFDDGGAFDGGFEDGGAFDGGFDDGGAFDGGFDDGGAFDGGAFDGGGDAERPIAFDIRTLNQPSPVQGVAIADLNADGRSELLVSTTSELRAHSAAPFNQLESARSLSDEGPFGEFLAADVTGDGLPDVIDFGGSRKRFFRNFGTGLATSTASVPVTAGPIRQALLANFGPGRRPTAVVRTDFPSRLVELEADTIASQTTALSAPAVDIAVGDLDGDGIDEVAVLLGTNRAVQVFKKNNAGELEPFRVWSTPESLSIAVGDWDGDGFADIVASGRAELSIVFGDRTQSGLRRLAVAAPFAAELSRLADADGDGRLDFIGLRGPRLAVIPNGGAAQIVSTSISSRWMAVGDLNGDGRADVALHSRGNGLVVLLSR